MQTETIQTHHDAIKPFYTPPEVAALLNLSVGTVLRYLRQEDLKGIKLRGRWRVPAAEVERISRPATPDVAV